MLITPVRDPKGALCLLPLRFSSSGGREEGCIQRHLSENAAYYTPDLPGFQLPPRPLPLGKYSRAGQQVPGRFSAIETLCCRRLSSETVQRHSHRLRLWEHSRHDSACSSRNRRSETALMLFREGRSPGPPLLCPQSRGETPQPRRQRTPPFSLPAVHRFCRPSARRARYPPAWIPRVWCAYWTPSGRAGCLRCPAAHPPERTATLSARPSSPSIAIPENPVRGTAQRALIPLQSGDYGILCPGTLLWSRHSLGETP